ncbi:CD1247 N-terminal domain-containing protein [uncultured Eubacterium sp.]|uniref:CD1247 N-terminal domain-containing protein n=1 Tax=uncultured Eubacterium sp. TaxID=165185 RepID=UPI0025F79CA4|nr:CD1247 N-terminal domain-containing protein [uncultured Eubacterium sp.]
METSESLGYLKGLIDGLDLDANKKETKVIKAIVDVLENLATDVDDMTEGLELVGEQIDAVDEDLADLEEFVYDDDDCDCDCCDDECEEYEVECPNCGETITVDEDTVMQGKFECPNCGEVLEFEVEYDDDCDCDDCDDCK